MRVPCVYLSPGFTPCGSFALFRERVSKAGTHLFSVLLVCDTDASATSVVRHLMVFSFSCFLCTVGEHTLSIHIVSASGHGSTLDAFHGM
jgi:hypothetical protein